MGRGTAACAASTGSKADKIARVISGARINSCVSISLRTVGMIRLEVRTMTDKLLAVIIMILGACLAPALIGIPIIIYGWHRFKEAS